MNERSPRYTPDLLAAITNLPPHTIVAAGSDEQMPQTVPNCRTLAEGIAASGGSVEFLLLDGAEHFHTVDHLAKRQGQLFQAVSRMMGLAN